jgi:glycosyltransferase involved in cell wall biosynthesis
MRVLHVMEATIGGTRRHLVELARGQQRAGLEVHVAAACLRVPDFERDLVQLESQGIGVTRISMLREVAPINDWRRVAELRALLRRVRPDIVHTHSSKAGVLGRWASLREGIGVRVHTPHTFAFLFAGMFSAPRRAFYRKLERWLCARTARIIAVSKGEARTIAGSGVVPEGRLRVIENGIDARPLREAQALGRGELDFSDAAPLLFCAGLLNVAKGQDLLVEALATPGLERVQCALAGEGELRPQLEARIAALGLSGRVRLLGFRPDVPALLASADLVVLPSRWEGMPYVLLEAMASARPILATPVDGARELIARGKCGRVARAISAPALADELRALIALPREERALMGRAGRACVEQHYTLERMVEGTIAVYREIA